MNNISENQKKKIPLVLKVLLIITGAILFLAVLFSVWFFFPVKEVPIHTLFTPDTIAYFSFDFNSKRPGIRLLKSRAKETILSLDMGSLEKTTIDVAFSSFFPKKISCIIDVKPDSDKPLLAGIAGFGNEIKLISLVDNYIDKALFRGIPVMKEKEYGHTYTIAKNTNEPEKVEEDEPPIAAYTFVSKNICLGTDTSQVKGIIKSFKKGYSKDSHEQGLAGVITQDKEEKDGYFFMDNSGGGLSKMIQAVEDKFAFAAFPSIDSIEKIAGYLWLTPEELSGTIRFECRDMEKAGDIKADVKFFYQALRRLFRPQNLALKGEIEIVKNTIVFANTVINLK